MWDFKCIAAALCFLTSNVLFIVHGVLMMNDNSSSKNAQTANANDGTIDHNFYSSNSAYDANKEQSAVKPMSFQFQYWKDLDPAYIETRWVDRAESRPIMMSAALFGAMAWFWLMVPIVQSAWVLSRGGKRAIGAHVTLAGLAVTGGIIELLARLLTVGMTNASMWLARDFNLNDWDEAVSDDGTGWRVLEMIHIVTRGMLLWVDAFEALAFFGITVVMFYSIKTEPRFKLRRSASIVVDSENDDGADTASGSAASAGSLVAGDANPSGASPPPSAFAVATSKVPIQPNFSGCFAWFGLFVGLLSILDFLADVLRFVDWKLFGRMALAMNALVGVIFLPIWLLCLAKELPKATERFENEERRASIMLNSGVEEMTALKGSEGEML